MSSKLTKVVANFETSLATKLANGATSGALTSITDKNGINLPSGKYCMIIDRGTGDEEHLLFDLSGTAISNVISVSRQGVQTVGVQNLNGHRAGAKGYLTDFVNLKIIVDMLNGDEVFDGTKPLKYDSAPALTDPRHIPDKAYIDASLSNKAELAANNVFTGQNSFTKSPTIPSAVSANQPVTLSQLMAAALVGISAGFENVDVIRNDDGSVRSIHDNVNGKTYVMEYDRNGFLSAFYDGASRSKITTVDGRIINKVTN
jgi:hypothetical protein